MRVAEFVACLARGGGHFEILPGEVLRYVGPEEVLGDAGRRFTRERKAEILAWLRTPINQQPKEDQLLLDYNPTLPPGYFDEARWFDARLMWPHGTPPAGPEAGSGPAKPAPGAAHRHENGSIGEATPQGDLW